MRKDVKRSLIIWPLFASVLVVMLSWLATDSHSFWRMAFDGEKFVTQLFGLQSQVHEDLDTLPSPSANEKNHRVALRTTYRRPEPVEVLHEEVGPPESEVKVVDRSEHGSRAIRMPDRLQRELMASIPPVKSPIETIDKTDDHVEAKNEQAEAKNEKDSRASQIAMELHEQSIVVELEAILSEIESETQRQSESEPDVASISEVDEELGLAMVAPVRDSTQELAGHDSAIMTILPEIEPPTTFDSNIDEVANSENSAGESVLLFAPAQPDSVNDPSNLDSILPKSVSLLAKPAHSQTSRMKPEVNGEATYDALPRSNQTHPGSPSIQNSNGFNPAGWPATAKLNQQLVSLSELQSGQDESAASVETWSDHVQAALAALQSCWRLGDEQAGQWIARLAELAHQGGELAESCENRRLQIQWLYLCYAIDRRVAVWSPVWRLHASDEHELVSSNISTRNTTEIEGMVADLREALVETGDANGWNEYLLLDLIEATAASDSASERSMVAKRFLSRLRWHGLHAKHRHWLDNETVANLSDAIRPWTRTAIDYASLLNQIEHQESNSIDTVSVEIAEAVQILQHSDHETANQIADAIDVYYRNANVRVAISEQLLNRMVPSIAPKMVPIRTRMLGSRVRGVSHVNSELDIKLSPSPDRWLIELGAIGNVHTRSVGLKGPVSLKTTGDSTFIASTPIEIMPSGIKHGDVFVEATGATRLRGIQTDYDGWPLIGSLVRTMANSEYRSARPVSSRLASRRIENQVGVEIDEKLEQQIGQATNQLSQFVLGPLGALRLDPKVVDMQTTEQRLLARYRLAGDWQLGAFTPRPRAWSNSLMSVQVHQSALNNTLEQLVPRDRPRPIVDMIRDGAFLFGHDTMTPPNDLPEDVSIQFAKTRPVTVEIEDGKLWLTLRIVKLLRGDQLELSRFIVRAAYVPQVDGLDAKLIREGHLSISGPRMSMRERLPIRAIFNKVLSPNVGFPLTIDALQHHPAAEGLAVSQLELREGWIAIGMSEDDSARVATRPTP